MSDRACDEQDTTVPSESWCQLCTWTFSCCCRRDGTSLGTRTLDLISRGLFWWAGMKDSCSFNRSTWDAITSSQMTAPSSNEKGVASSDEIVRTDLEGDYPAVPVRVYSPVDLGKDESCPLLVFMHGGGMCIQSEKSKQPHDLVIELVRRFRCRAVSVGYRLSPEHPFPCALRDAYSVLRWVHTSGEFGADSLPPIPLCQRSSIFLGGDSAGGNLALVLSLLALNNVDADGRPDSMSSGLIQKLKQNLLMYPSLYEQGLPSSTADMVYMLPASARNFYMESYLGDRNYLLQDWRVAPLKAPSFVGLPPTAIVCGDLDPLCPSNLLLADALIASNVQVALREVKDVPHGFLTFPNFATDSKRVAETFDWLESVLTRTSDAKIASLA